MTKDIFKRIIATISVVLSFGHGRAQVVFCPSGATWNYSFVNIPAWGGIYNYINEQVTYVNDSIVGGDSAKVLTHRFYYAQCYNTGFSQTKKTCIKQRGDTVFFRNARTQNTWQILYNFAVTPSGGWTTTLLKADNTPITYSISIDSVGQIVKNSTNLKRLFVPGGHITERLGNSKFLFNFLSYAPGCDGYYFAESLCYADNTLGQIVFTEKSCNYSGSVNVNSINEMEGIKLGIFPNPTSDILYIYSDRDPISKVTIWSPTGQVLQIDKPSSMGIQVRDLPPGLYFVDIQSDFISTRRKFVKE